MRYPFSKNLVMSVALLVICKMSVSQNNVQGIEVKINQLLKKMTLEEKIAMLHANSIFTTAGVPRLGIPGLSTDDGPLGIREELDAGGGWAPANLTTDSATFFPNGSAIAATWNPELANRYGIAIGEEARARNKDVLLAPAFNIDRTPVGGRTYEYYSEDPFLNSQLAVAAVKGIQSWHVAACVKHYVLNNQETERGRVNVEISERALREIYLPAFKASIEQGHAWTIMSAYNKVRGVYCSENAYLLQTILKEQWNFQGIVISDWGGTHSTVNAANNGLDVEMGSPPPYDNYYFGHPLLEAVRAGKVSERTVDDKVRRILRVVYETSLSNDRPSGKLNTPAHTKTAFDIAAESIVLLKNDRHLLPLNLPTIKTIAVIGDNAVRTNHLGGFGAGVKAQHEITPLQGLQNALANRVDIKFAQGYRAHNLNPGGQSPGPEIADSSLVAEAATKAALSDVAILFIGGNRDVESESRDRQDLRLPFGEQQLVDAVTAANANTIVVVVGGAPYDLKKVKENNHTIVWEWYNGSEGGNALAAVITGAINPSGKLPFTFPVALEESPAHYEHTFPGEDLTAHYTEGILVGYRWYDTKAIAPLFPFGYGLSYTSFSYSRLQADKTSYATNDKIKVTAIIKNVGKMDGKETVELYVGKAGSAVERAEKELKGFTKVWIPAGREIKIALTVPVKSLAYYDEQKRAWVVEPGKYKLMAASSSRDIRAAETINVIGGQ